MSNDFKDFVKEKGNQPVYPNTDEHYFEGLSKREYFAVMAMQSLISNGDRISVAETAVKIADELMEMLHK